MYRYTSNGPRDFLCFNGGRELFVYPYNGLTNVYISTFSIPYVSNWAFKSKGDRFEPTDR